MKKKKKEKKEYIDDGHTVYDMDVEGFKWHDQKKAKKLNDELKITRKERRAMIFAAFRVYLPQLIIIILGFAIAIGIVVLWLH